MIARKHSPWAFQALWYQYDMALSLNQSSRVGCNI